MRVKRLPQLLIAGAVAALAVAVAAALALRGTGARVLAVTPGERDGPASVWAPIRVTVDRPLLGDASGLSLTFDPPVTGSLRVDGTVLVFSPTAPLLHETAYRARLEGFGRAPEGPVSVETTEWTFRTAPRSVSYLAVDAKGLLQVYAAPHRPEAGPPRQVTAAPLGVSDFDIASETGAIAYAAAEADGSINIWRQSPAGGAPVLLLACPSAQCTDPVWSPDGRLLAVTVRQRTTAMPSLVAPPRIWLLDLTSGVNRPLFQDEGSQGYGARWSSNGEWLSFTMPDRDAVGVFNIRDGTLARSPSTTRSAGEWRPGGAEFVLTREWTGERIVETHAFLVDARRGDLRDLSVASRGAVSARPVADGAPAWSPDGLWLAVRRRFPAERDLAPPGELWLLAADGSSQLAIVTAQGLDHDAPAWSPDGRWLAFVRAQRTGDPATSDIWVRDMDSGVLVRLAAGIQPRWGP